MAEWIYAPSYDSRWTKEPPPTLITRLSDAKSIRREKNPSAPQTWDETYNFSGAQHDAAYAFFQTKYLLTAFTKLSYDIAASPTWERSVYFAGPWPNSRAGQDWYVVTLAFELAF